jgi:hypothetical protein
MIISKLIGGLGNQFFQYAAARYLAEINAVELKLDLSEFKSYKLHKYSLKYFNIIEKIASQKDLKKVKHVNEKYFHYDKNFKKNGKNTLLKGYWQSEKYFNEISSIIKNDFKIKSKLKGRNLSVSKKIADCNSVSLHIRRKDYKPNSYKDQIFDLLNEDYYRAAISNLSKKEKNLFFFIFSDDHKWVKNNIKLDYPFINVDHNTAATNYEDLRLMSLCKHNIIGNSTFSWWGAWLNGNKNKSIYAPKKWFNKNAKNLNSKDIIPKKWIRI